jgi:hypothetical protein
MACGSHLSFRNGSASCPFDIASAGRGVPGRPVREASLTRHDLGQGAVVEVAIVNLSTEEQKPAFRIFPEIGVAAPGQSDSTTVNAGESTAPTRFHL